MAWAARFTLIALQTLSRSDAPFSGNAPVSHGFAKRFGHEPDSFAAHGYDAMYIVWEAVKKAGLNRTRIRDALAETKDFHGVTGMISFDHRGNDMRGVDFAVVKDLPLVRGRIGFSRSGRLPSALDQNMRAIAAQRGAEGSEELTEVMERDRQMVPQD